ncbi:MAG: 30S ribosomal protein S9 [Candidatus Falkowbacteria bacterium]|nr:30S ribosomal protein S9 [Candidatus Falkowbacteria bacterium]
MTEVKTKTVVKKVKADAPAGTYIQTIGKRKTASARVRLFKGGKGVITVNGAPMAEYFKTPLMQMIIQDPLKGTSLEGQFDITAMVCGGGKQGQAEALRHGIARALLVLDVELRPVLKAQRWLTRDARKKERKKPGLKKARKAPQWSKR